MRNNYFVVLMAFSAVVADWGSAARADTVYSSETAFLAQTNPGYYLENFSAFSSGSYQAPTLTLGPTLGAEGQPTNGYGYTISSTQQGSGADDGPNSLYSGNSSMSLFDWQDALVVTFNPNANPVTAVGGNFIPVDSDSVPLPTNNDGPPGSETGPTSVSVLVTLNNGSQITRTLTYSIADDPAELSAFIGFTTTIPIKSITIGGVNDDGGQNDGDDFAQMTNFYVGTAAASPVPLPRAALTGLLLLGGFAACSVGLKRLHAARSISVS